MADELSFEDAIKGAASPTPPNGEISFEEAIGQQSPGSQASSTPHTDKAFQETRDMSVSQPAWMRQRASAQAAATAKALYDKSGEPIGGRMPRLPPAEQLLPAGTPPWLKTSYEAGAGVIGAGQGLVEFLESPRALLEMGATTLSGGLAPALGYGFMGAEMGPFLKQQAIQTWKAATGQLPPRESAEAAANIPLLLLPAFHAWRNAAAGKTQFRPTPVAPQGAPVPPLPFGPDTPEGEKPPPPPPGMPGAAGAAVVTPPAPIPAPITIARPGEQPGVPPYASKIQGAEPVPKREVRTRMGEKTSLWPLDKGVAGAREEPVSTGKRPVAPETAQAETAPIISDAKYKHLNRKANAGHELTESERQQVLAYENRERVQPGEFKEKGYTAVTTPEEAGVTFESDEDLLARTKPGEERAAAITERRQQVEKAALDLKPGDIIVPSWGDGDRYVVDRTSQKKPGEVAVYKEGTDKSQSHIIELTHDDHIIRAAKEAVVGAVGPVDTTEDETRARPRGGSVNDILKAAGYTDAEINAMPAEKAISTAKQLREIDPRERPGEAATRRESEQAQVAEAEEHMARGGDELLDVVAQHGLPAKSSPRQKWAGELENIRADVRNPHRTGEKLNYANVFKKNAPDPEVLAQELKRRGFDVENAGDALQLIQDRIRTGKKVFGSEARGQALEEQSYEDYRPQRSLLPGWKKSPKQLDKDIEKAVEAEKSLPTVKAEPGTDIVSTSQDKEQVERLLGEHAYKGSIVNVIIKELLQNAFDAVRDIGRTSGAATDENPGRIKINYDWGKRTIQVTDDGAGMSPQTIVEAFLRTGGTKKSGDPQNTSGGLGVAKLAFLKGSERIRLVTVKDGLKTVMDVNQAQIRADQIPLVKTRTNEPNGTTVTVKIPETYVDKNGETQKIAFDTDPDYLKNPLFGPVDVSVNDQTHPIGIHTTGWQKDNVFNFRWGHADVHVDPRPLEKYDWGETMRPKYQVMSAGLHQFDISPYEIFGSDRETEIKHNMVIDIRPHVDTTAPDYPFNNQREGWRGTVEKDAGAMYAYLKREGLRQQLEKDKETFSRIKVLSKIPLSDLGKDLTSKQVELSEASKPEQKAAGPKVTSIDVQPDKVITRDSTGKTNVQSHEQFNKPTFSAEREIDFQKSKMDVSHLDPGAPLYHNNTNVKFEDIKGAPELHAKLGNFLLAFMREFGRAFGNENPDYHALVETDPAIAWRGGISYDKEYAGLNIVNPFKAIWLNPAGISKANISTPARAAAKTLHTMVHEITHVPERNEGSDFTSELSENHGRLAAAGFPVKQFEDALKEIYTKHWDTLHEINNRFRRPNTANSAESFKAGSALGPEPGGAKGSDEGVPGKHAREDVGVPEQRSTGPGRAKETDRPAGTTLGDIISGKTAEAARESGAGAAPAAEPGPVKKTALRSAPAADKAKYGVSKWEQMPFKRGGGGNLDPGPGLDHPKFAGETTEAKTPAQAEKDVSNNALIEQQRLKPRVLTPEEHARLAEHETQLQRQKDALSLDQTQAHAAQDMARVAENDLKMSELLDKIQDVQNARKTGTAKGQPAPMFPREDFSPDKMKRDKSAINRGRVLTPFEEQDVDRWNQLIKDKQEKLDAFLGSPEAKGYWDQQRRQAEAFHRAQMGLPHDKLTAIRPNPKQLQLMSELKAAENAWKGSLEVDRRKQLRWYQKTPDFLLKWRRAFVISGIHSMAKLASATIEGLVMLPTRELVGTALKELPFIRPVAERAPIEGYGFNIRAEAAAQGEMWKNLLSDWGKNISGKKPDFESVFGDITAMPPELQNYVGYLHSFLKSPLARNQFTRAYVQAAEHSARHGVDITDPFVQMELGRQATESSVFWRFQNRNMASNVFRGVINSLQRQGWLGKTAAVGLQTDLPVVTVPSNVIARTFEGVFGTIPGFARLGRAYYRGIETLKPAEADLIMRNIKTGSFGLALTLLGAFNPSYFGGFYRPGKKKDPDEPGWGATRIPGTTTDIPAYLQDNPFLILPQFGATMTQVMGSYLRKTDAETAGLWLGVFSAVTGAVESQPYVQEAKDIAKSLDPRMASDVLGEHARSILIPMAVQQIAQMTDPEEKRYPRGIMENIMAGLPGYREQVPSRLPSPQQLGPRRRGLAPRKPSLIRHR